MTSAPSCRCRPPDQAATATPSVVLVMSTNQHTRERIDAVLRDHGVPEPECTAVVRRLPGADADRLLPAVLAALTVLEQQEVRALELPDEPTTHDDLLAIGMQATNLARFVARRDAAALLALTHHPDRFHSRYQPIVDLSTGDTYGFEALLRARGDDGEELPAWRLFEAAEAGEWSPLLDRIGRETALRDAAGWLGGRNLFINFLPTSIYRPEVCLATTHAAARTYGIAMDQVIFEVVETERVASVDHLLRIVSHYRDHGSRIALDDVGAGHGTLALLAQVAPDIVKIDRDIVQALPSEAAVAVVRAVIAMSRELGATVLAEGVETEEQLTVVRDLGVSLSQGFLHARPMLVEDLLARVER